MHPRIRRALTSISLSILASVVLGCGGPAEKPRTSTRSESTVEPHQGNLSRRGGSPTVRESYGRQLDNPNTTNDESNDQPVGHFGTVTLIVSQAESGHTYTLDVEMDGSEATRIYFPKGGWVDLEGCELEDGYAGKCIDENGRHWTFEGERQR